MMATLDHTVAPPTPTRLTPGEIEEHRQTFAERGYLVFRNVVDRDRLGQLRDSVFAAFDEARLSGSLFAGGGLLSGHLNCFTGEESRFIYDTLEAYGVIDLVRAI